MRYRSSVAIARRALTRLVHQRTVRCFQRWRVVTALRSDLTERRQAVIKRTIGTWSHRQLASAFAEWSVSAVESKKTRMRLERTMLRMLLHRQACALDGWRGAVADSLQLRAVATRAVQALAQSACTRSFRRWSEFVLEHRRLSQLLHQLLSRWRLRYHARCFASWRLVAMNQQTAAAATVRRLMHRSLDVAFCSWAAYVADRQLEAARREHCVRQILSRWMGLAIARSFGGWREWCVARRRLLQLMRRAGQRFIQRHVGAAMTTWKKFVQEATSKQQAAARERLESERVSLDTVRQEVEAAQQQVHELQVQVEESQRKMLERFETYRVQQALHMTARRNRRSMHACFVLWHVTANTAVSHRAATSARIASIRKHSSRRRIGRTIALWSEVVQLIRRGREKQTMMWRRLDRGKKLLAFGRWVGMLAIGRHRERVALQVVGRLTQATLSRGFGGWRQSCESMRSQRLILHRAAARMSHRGLSAAVAQWRQYAHDHAQAARAAKRVVLHIQHSVSGRAYRAWHAAAEWRRRSRHLSEKLVRRWRMSTELRCMETWRFAVADAHEGRTASAQKEEIIQLHRYFDDQQKRLARIFARTHAKRQLGRCVAAWRMEAHRLRQGPEELASRWAANLASAGDEREQLAQELRAEKSARAAAEQRALDEASRLARLTAVLQRAEQRARDTDLAIAQKSKRLAQAEEQLSWLVLGASASGPVPPFAWSGQASDVEVRRASDGSGVSVEFDSSEEGSEEGTPLEDDRRRDLSEWTAVVDRLDVGGGSPQSRVSRLSGFADQ